MRRREWLLGTGAAALASGPVLANDPPTPTMKIRRLAWAGIQVEVGQATVFVDASASPTLPLTATTPNRYALVTHHHGDHADPAALKTVFNEGSFLVCHRDVAPWLNTQGLRTQVVGTYEPVFMSRTRADVVAFAVPASDGFGHPQVSWILDGGGRRIIHCGDTLWHGHWWDIARAYGPFDFAFMPINGFRQVSGRYVDAGIPMGLTPEQAVAAAKVLRAKVIVPIHFGEPGEGYIEVPDPEGAFRRAAQQAGMATRIVKPGEWVTGT